MVSILDPTEVQPLSAIALGILSLAFRSLVVFRPSEIGSDFAFISCSLQLTLVVGGGNTLGLNVVYAIVFLAIWALTLKLVQKSIQASKEDNPNFDSSFYQIIAIFTGALSVFLEISAVRGVALLG